MGATEVLIVAVLSFMAGMALEHLLSGPIDEWLDRRREARRNRIVNWKVQTRPSK